MSAKRLKNFLSDDKVQEALTLFALFVFSLLVRRIGVKHGFPLLTHPDEAIVLHPVFNMSRYQTLNPGIFNRPNQILYSVNFLYLNLVSYLKFGESLAGTFPDNQVFFHYYARLLISFLGSLIPPLAYKIGKQFNQNYALPTGLVFAFFPLYTLHSLYITPDIPITLFTLLVLFFTLRYLKQEDEKSIYLAVLFSAINTAEKYPGLISLSIVFLGVLFKFIENPDFSLKKDAWKLIKKFLFLSLFFLTALFIVAPFLFIEFEKVIAAIRFETATTHLGADNLGWGGNLLFYIQNFGSWSNIFAILFLGLGIFALARWRDKHALILLYGALYWIILSRLSLHWERWALPMYITPLFLIAMGITTFWNLIKGNAKLKLLSIIILLFLGQQLIATVHTAARISFTDTRLIALAYCQENGITPQNSIYEGYSPFLPQDPKNIDQEEIDNKYDQKYIILSSYMFGRFYSEPTRYQEKITFYDNIRNNNRLIEKFEPTPEAGNTIEQIDDILFYIKKYFNLIPNTRFKGPTIEIYEILS